MDLHQIILAASDAVQQAAETIPHVTATSQTAADAAAHASEESGGVLGTLGINWMLFVAQLVNFGLVLLIFWRWIAKPLTKSLSDRLEKIESGLKNAEYMEAEKKNFELWRAEQMKAARVEAEKIIKMASDTAALSKQEITQEGQLQAAKIIEQAKSQIEQEKATMLTEVKQEVATLVVLVSEKILKQKLDAKKDQELIVQSVENLK